jgi:raffinose/stachyose/melibiose transport system substrate-binding protein
MATNGSKEVAAVGVQETSTRWRGLGLVALLTAALAMLAVGAEGTQAKPQQQVTLRLMAQSTGQGGNQQFQAVIDNFEKAYPNIDIEAEYLPIGTTYANALRTRLRSGNAPDVFYVTSGSGGLASVLPLASAGFVANLADRPWAKRVPVNSRPLYTIGRRLYAVPIQVVPVGVMYQPNVYSQIGVRVPQTMAQFLAACRTATSRGKAGLLNVAGASVQNAALLAVTMAANYVQGQDSNWNAKRARGQVTFAGSGGWRRTLQRILDMKEAGCFPRGVEAMDNVPATGGFVSGNVPSWVLPTSIIGLMKGINRNIQLNMYPFPGETAAQTRINASATDALAMYSRTRNRQAAQRFVDFWARDGQSRFYASLTGGISLHQADTGAKLRPELSGISPLLKTKTKVFPAINLDWKNPEVFNILGQGVQGLLTGQRTPDQILRAMDAAWQN